jgi:prepilin-type N-terminal cleavage/methylation domain-containing protein
MAQVKSSNEQTESWQDRMIRSGFPASILSSMILSCHDSVYPPKAPAIQRLGDEASRPSRFVFRRAFSLIELLVVIAVIAILAALTIPVSGVVRRNNVIRRTTGEMEQLITAIEAYKAKTGFYPPDNPDDYARNQLYFELAGTVLTNQLGSSSYQTLDGNSRITDADVSSPVKGFGPKVTGFLNATKGAGGDDASQAKNFLVGWKSTQLGGLVTNASGAVVRVLVGPVPWPPSQIPQPIPTVKELNPWRYNSSSPTNSPGSYDLWIDFYIGGKLYRMGNWSKQYLNP